jgi:hypothetical protein
MIELAGTVLLAVIFFSLFHMPLGKGYRMKGHFMRRTITFEGIAIADLRRSHWCWRAETPGYPFDQKRAFLTLRGAIKRIVKDHSRARSLRIA